MLLVERCRKSHRGADQYVRMDFNKTCPHRSAIGLLECFCLFAEVGICFFGLLIGNGLLGDGSGAKLFGEELTSGQLLVIIIAWGSAAVSGVLMIFVFVKTKRKENKMLTALKHRRGVSVFDMLQEQVEDGLHQTARRGVRKLQAAVKSSQQFRSRGLATPGAGVGLDAGRDDGAGAAELSSSQRSILQNNGVPKVKGPPRSIVQHGESRRKGRSKKKKKDKGSRSKVKRKKTMQRAKSMKRKGSIDRLKLAMIRHEATHAAASSAALDGGGGGGNDDAAAFTEAVLAHRSKMHAKSKLKSKMKKKKRGKSKMARRATSSKLRRARSREAFMASMEKAFAAIDKDADAHIDFGEFVGVCLHGEHHDVEHEDEEDSQLAEVRELFELLDEDGGGALEVGELAHALRTNARASELARNYDALNDLLAAVEERRKKRKRKRRKKSKAATTAVAAFGGSNRATAKDVLEDTIVEEE